MKKPNKRTLWGIGITIGAMFILIAAFFFFRITDDAEMTEATLEWGRLAPFPKEARNLDIHSEGNAFARTFRGSFSCPKEPLVRWVSESPGLQDAKIEEISVSKKRYVISPGGNANFAEVVIDYETGKVEFRVSWS